MTDPVNKLVEELLPRSCCRDCAKHSLRIVLSAIQRGEVVNFRVDEKMNKSAYGEIVLKPEFKRFMEEHGK